MAASVDLAVFDASCDLTRRKVHPSLGRLVSRKGQRMRVIGTVTALPLVQAEVEACPPVTLGERRRSRWTAAVTVSTMSNSSLAMIGNSANFAKNM